VRDSGADFLPEARYQRCMVLFYRNVFSHIPSTRVREVSHMLKAIHAQESRRRTCVVGAFPRWTALSQSGRRATTAHRPNNLGGQMHEYEAALSATPI
jgi:hypothetical protein